MDGLFPGVFGVVLGLLLGLTLRRRNPDFATDDKTMQRYDSELRRAMSQVGLTTWKGLREQSGLTASQLNCVRQGLTERVPVGSLQRLAQTLKTDLATVLGDYSSLKVSGGADAGALKAECERLRYQLEHQGQQQVHHFREAVLRQLEPLLVQYPTLQQVAQQRPEFPASTVLRLLVSLDNLLADWQYEPIGRVWQPTAYDPALHVPDCDDLEPGETVYVRFVGYRQGDQVITPAKVSRSLP